MVFRKNLFLRRLRVLIVSDFEAIKIPNRFSILKGSESFLFKMAKVVGGK